MIQFFIIYFITYCNISKCALDTIIISYPTNAIGIIVVVYDKCLQNTEFYSRLNSYLQPDLICVQSPVTMVFRLIYQIANIELSND